MKHLLLTIVCLGLVYSTCLAQRKSTTTIIQSNTIHDYRLDNFYLELSGGVNLLSLNYEHQIIDLRTVRFNINGGFGIMNKKLLFEDKGIPSHSMRFGVGCLIGRGIHKIHLGLGLDITANKWLRDIFKGVLDPSISYRYMPEDAKKPFFFIQFAPQIELGDHEQFNNEIGANTFGIGIGKIIHWPRV